LTPPSTPAGVNAANGANGAPVTGGLNWNAPAGGATSYVVIWTGPSSGSATTISGAQLTFATPGTYSMTVTAVNATGSSAPSAAVNVTVR
jgi:PKD repeat protein